MENKVRKVQDYLAEKGLIVTETSIFNAALEIACRRDLLYDLLFANDMGSTKEIPNKEDKLEANKAEEVQDYLNKKGIIVSKTWIANASIELTRRLGAGDWTFVCFYNEKGSGSPTRTSQQTTCKSCFESSDENYKW